MPPPGVLTQGRGAATTIRQTRSPTKTLSSLEKESLQLSFVAGGKSQRSKPSILLREIWGKVLVLNSCTHVIRGLLYWEMTEILSHIRSTNKTRKSLATPGRRPKITEKAQAQDTSPQVLPENEPGQQVMPLSPHQPPNNKQQQSTLEEKRTQRPALGCRYTRKA